MKRMQKIWILCLILSLMCVMYGCGNSMGTEKEDRTEESVEVEIQTTEAPVQATHEPKETAAPTLTMTPEPTATPVPEPLKSLPPKVIEYGDKVSVTYTKTSQELQWEYNDTQEFQVATTSKQFQNEFEISEEAAMKQVDEAIGKTVGDTFTLWYEGGDGRYGYEYTIVEVKSRNPDIAEYGDEILADYSMTHYGVDTCDGEKIHTGQLMLHLLNTNVFFAMDEDGACSSRQGDLELKKILGKTIGDQFQSESDSYEDSFNYQFTIKEIHKAVKYGDTIVAEVREANTLDAKSYEEHSEEEWILDLGVMDGLDSLDGEALSLENIISLYKELIGKKAGDRAVFVREDGEKREIYNIMIHDVAACESEYAEDYIPLIMAEEGEVLKFYQYFDEYREYMGDEQETYSEPALRCIVIDDRKEQMVYEYSYFSYSNGVDCHLTDKYEYILEYDEKGQLVKETIRGNRGNVWGCDIWYEYKYNEQGVCIELIKYMPGYEMHYYYDDMGKPIKAEYISDDNIWDEEYSY